MAERKKNTSSRLGNAQLANFCDQLSLIMRAGLPLYEGVSSLHKDLPDSALKTSLEAVDEAVSRGEPLWHALELAPGFPAYMVHTVRLGEEIGETDGVLSRLGEYYARQAAINQRIRNAVTYPVLLIAMMAVVITILLWKVLPTFEQVYQQLGGGTADFGLGWVTACLGVLYALLLAMAVMIVISRLPSGRLWINRFLEKFFLTRNLSEKIAQSRLLSSMSLLISSGIPAERALELSQPVVEHSAVARRVADCQKRLQNEESLPDALTGSGLFNDTVNRFIRLGQRTGALDTAMQQVAGPYDEEVNATINNTVAAVEPALVGLLAVIIGAVLLSVMMPLVQILSAIG